MIRPVATVNVVPNLPEVLHPLRELAYNLRWAWNHDSTTLFRRLDPDLWETTSHNPVWLLGMLSQERLEAASQDPAYLAHMNRVLADYEDYMSNGATWYSHTFGEADRPIVAYFSMEFGITDCLQNYSGGLGVLSGDHLKSASDLGIPLIGVGLLYQEGYFQQYLNIDGFQQESYPLNDYAILPVTLQTDDVGQPIKISVPLPGRDLYAVIWKVQVGRIALYLLDTNIDDNKLDEDRNLTDRLYGGDRRTRIRQEILIGIGGVRALDALGLRPTICHMNEGHSAFLAIERARQLMAEQALTFEQAKTVTAAANIFTTHTPVPAGLERFSFDLIDEHFESIYTTLGLTREQFLDLGREDMGGHQLFSMAVLALKLSSGANGVARLHGKVSRHLWQWLYPKVPEPEVPIESVTNGIHIQSWISPEMGTLLDRYLDPAWRLEDSNPQIWEAIDSVPDTELWRTHARRRERLVGFTRQRLIQQYRNRGVPQSEIENVSEILNPDALTIGFARRFATYKRATLLLRDRERLANLLGNPLRPVQIIFAGKAHPHDTAGKELIREIVHLARNPDFRHALVFVENYDMHVARYLVQGVDVWLNTPRRPKEASGTSGMKVIYNGGLNCSILDGWWAEAYNPALGWAIGNGEEYAEHDWEHQDFIESQALYNLLEEDIVPLFYNRGRDGVPHEWIASVKNSMRALSPYFNSHRMLQEYTEMFYMPAVRRNRAMTGPNLQSGLDYAAWRVALQKGWRQIQILNVEVPQNEVKIGNEMTVKAVVDLGAFTPNDVCVQLYSGALNTRGDIDPGGDIIDMQLAQDNGGRTYTFAATFAYRATGDRGISVRVLPRHPYLPNPVQPALITWA